MSRVPIFLFLIVLTLGISYGIHAQSFIIFAKLDIGATYDDLAALGIAKFLPYVLIPLLIGILMNKTNRAYIIFAGVAMHAIPLFMASMAETILELIMYKFAIGAAHAFIWPPTNSILNSDYRMRIKFVSGAVMFFLLGLVVGPLMGMVIVDATDNDYRLLFQISAGVMSCSMITAMLLRTQIPETKGITVDLASFKKILHFPAAVALVFFTTAISGILCVIYPAFLTDHDIGTSTILFLYFILGACRVGAMLLVNHLHKWLSPMLTLSIGMVTGGLAISMLGTDLIHFAIAMCMMAFGIMVYPICLDVILSRVKRSAANKMIGVYASIVGLGWFAGPAIAGYVAYWYGPDAPYMLFCIVGVGMIGVAVAIHKSLARVETRHKKAVSVNHNLKNHFNIILLNIGLMNRALAKTKTYESIPYKVRHNYHTLSDVLTRTNTTLDEATDLVDSSLVNDIRVLVDNIKSTDPSTGVGKGYPNYDQINGNIDKCVSRLDEEVEVDIMLNVRNWLAAHRHK